MFEYDKSKYQHGGALLNVVVAVGLGGIVVAGMTKMMSNSMRAQKRVSNDVDKSAIKQMLLDVVDCKESLDQCNGTNPINVYRHRKDGPELFIKNTGSGSRFGFWALRANCNGTDDGIIVRAARLKPNKSIFSTNKEDFQPDPLSNQIYTWNNDQSLLFGDGIEICGGTNGQCGWQHKGVSVFKGTATQAFKILDLSKYVGKRITLVKMRVDDNDTTDIASYINFRTAGLNKQMKWGSSSGYAGDNAEQSSYAILETDENGKIEFNGQNNVNHDLKVKITLEGFMGC